MRVLVIYDSLYGNTQKIAQAIGEGLAGVAEASASVEVVRAGDARPVQLAGLDLLLVGAPTHGCRPSPAMHAFLEGIPKAALAGVKVAAFDTRTDVAKLKGGLRTIGKILDHFGYAALRISSSLEKKGGRVVKSPEGFFVQDTQGPLADGELERAANWGRQFAA